MVDFLLPLKKGKHLMFVLKGKFPKIRDEFWKFRYSKKEYVYDESRYRAYSGGVSVPSSSTFWVNHLLIQEDFSSLPSRVGVVPRQLFCVWAGENELTENRSKSLEVLRRANSDIDIHLITAANLHEWILEEHPLHPAYPYLSYNHRSDYLRAYLMHHYGGAYSDIKGISTSWAPYLDQLNEDDLVWVVGPSERDSLNSSPAYGPGPLGEEQKHYYWMTIFQSAYACKPYTEFTYSHLSEIERRLDYFYSLLKDNPAVQPFGLNLNYPVPWNGLHGQIFNPLCLKYWKHIKAFEDFSISFSDHR